VKRGIGPFLVPAASSAILPDVTDLIPSRAITDRLCRVYFENFEHELRILHHPAFWSDYQRYWDVREEEKSIFIDLIPQMMLALVLASVFDDPAEPRS
jgi:hypothetical protein